MERAGHRKGRQGRRALSICVVASLLAALSLVGTTGTAQAVSDGWQQRMLHKVNAVRAEAGVPPVRLCRALARSARAYAVQMAQTESFGHVGPDGRTAQQRMSAAGYRSVVYGENIGAGQETVVQVMRQWRASPTHYATMTDPRLTDVGFGYASSDRQQYPTYWVQNYGTGGAC